MHNRNKLNRRDFVRYSGTGIAALGLAGIPSLSQSQPQNEMKPEKTIRIRNVDSNFEREPLKPYRFKGSVVTEGWQVAAWIESDSGIHKIGLGGQGTLWSDSTVFASHSTNGGNALMYAMSERALQMMKGNSFTNPHQLLDDLLPEIYEYGKKITGNRNLRKTFALNALVCVDNAAWLMYAAENNIKNFDDMIPAKYKPGSYRQSS
jgi:hypothetical protein